MHLGKQRTVTGENREQLGKQRTVWQRTTNQLKYIPSLLVLNGNFWAWGSSCNTCSVRLCYMTFSNFRRTQQSTCRYLTITYVTPTFTRPANFCDGGFSAAKLNHHIRSAGIANQLGLGRKTDTVVLQKLSRPGSGDQGKVLAADSVLLLRDAGHGRENVVRQPSPSISSSSLQIRMGAILYVCAHL